MTEGSRPRIALLGAAALMAMVGCQRAAPPTPVAAFSETTVARAAVDGHVRHRFSFRNPGAETLEIKRVTSNCGCTITQSPKTQLAPGQSSYIEADMTVLPNRRQSSVYVETNDPRNPFVVLTLAATGGFPNHLEFLPSVLRLRVAPGGTARANTVLRLTAWKDNGPANGFDGLALASGDPDRLIVQQATPTAAPSAVLLWQPPTITPEGWLRIDALPDRVTWLLPLTLELRAATASGPLQAAVTATLGDEEAGLKSLLLVSADVR